jgi:dihydrofolate reductase
MFAIAAMSKNRVIGNGDTIPWRIPDEFRWFRRKTLGSVIIMGRRTFETLPKPLDGRLNVVLTRHPARLLADPKFQERFKHALVGPAAHRHRAVEQLDFPKIPNAQVSLVRGIASLDRAGLTEHAWLCGGAQLYEQFLPRCSDLYLSVIDREVEGDAFFPAFEHLFDLAGVVAEFADFRVFHYVRNEVQEGRSSTEAIPRPARRRRGSSVAAPPPPDAIAAPGMTSAGPPPQDAPPCAPACAEPPQLELLEPVPVRSGGAAGSGDPTS